MWETVHFVSDHFRHGSYLPCAFSFMHVREDICSSVTNIPSWTDWAITKTGHVGEPFVELEKAGHCPLDPTAHVVVIFSVFFFTSCGQDKAALIRTMHHCCAVRRG